ncbi:hypothetical protein [Bradyrhizobium diazoefficiens]
MGGKGGDDGSFTGNAAASSGPFLRGIVGDQAPPTSTTDLSLPPVTPPVEPPVMPTQGDDAKTPGGDGTSPPPVGGDNGSGSKTDTGSVAASTLAAPSYWFNQPISTLAPKPIPKKGGSIKTTGGSV